MTVYYEDGRFVSEHGGLAHGIHLALHGIVSARSAKECQYHQGALRACAEDDEALTLAVVDAYPLEMTRFRDEADTARGELRSIATGKPAPGKLGELASSKLLMAEDLTEAEVLRHDYIIKGWLDANAEGIVFGDWNVGKSFVVLDIGARVALGLPWFGQRVRKSKVLYLGYEGKPGLRKRVQALRRKYQEFDAAPFAWWSMRHPITGPKGHAELEEARQHFTKRVGGFPDLVIVDPLRNALGGSDSDADKVEMLRGEIRAFMEAGKCTVLFVHHTGHGNKDRARGDSGIVAGTDSELRVDAPEQKGAPHKITATKQRDSEKATVHFRLRVVPLGQDQDGDTVTTCIVDEAAEPEAVPVAPGPSADEKIDEAATAILRLLGRETKAGRRHSRRSLVKLAPSHGIQQRIAETALDRLELDGRVTKEAQERKGGRGSDYRLANVGELPEEGASALF